MTTHQSYLRTYTPHIPASVWSTVRPHFLEVMATYSEHRSLRQVQTAASRLSGYLDWALQLGLITVPQQAANPALISVYADHRAIEASPATAGSERNFLHLAYGLPYDGPQFVGLANDSTKPYTHVDLTQIRHWAEHQSTRLQTRVASALAAFGLGCGLTLSEMLGVRGADIVGLADGNLGVNVDGRSSRTVPALTEWLEVLDHVKSDAHDGGYVVSHLRDDTRYTSGDIRGLLQRMTGDIRPTPARMRTTWLVTHLDARTPLNALLPAAGVAYASFVSRLVPHMRHLTPEEELAALRGPQQLDSTGGVE